MLISNNYSMNAKSPAMRGRNTPKLEKMMDFVHDATKDDGRFLEKRTSKCIDEAVETADVYGRTAAQVVDVFMPPTSMPPVVQNLTKSAAAEVVKPIGHIIGGVRGFFGL